MALEERVRPVNHGAAVGDLSLAEAHEEAEELRVDGRIGREASFDVLQEGQAGVGVAARNVVLQLRHGGRLACLDRRHGRTMSGLVRFPPERSGLGYL